MANTLEPGQVRTGQLIDGVSGTPFVSCALTQDSRGGLRVSVPFILGEDQFSTASSWFLDEQLPESLLYKDDAGTVMLTGLRRRGFRGGAFYTASFDADVAIFGEPKSIKPQYKVKTFISQIDGLNEFSQFRPIAHDLDQGESGYTMTVRIASGDRVTWRHGGYTYAIRASPSWNWGGQGDFSAIPAVRFESSTHRGATVQEHFGVHRTLRALLVLATGTTLRWRGHRALDSHFPLRTLDGREHGPAEVEVHVRPSVRDLKEANPAESKLTLPMFTLADLGSTGLRRWFALYADDVLRRAVAPTVEVINGASVFLEPRITMIAHSLEGMGYYRDPNRTSHVKLHKQIERCLSEAGLSWPEIGSNLGIARAIAKINNAIKHPELPEPADSVHLYLVAGLAVLIMRLQLIDLLNLSDDVRSRFLRSNDAFHAVDAFKRNGITIGDDGSFQT